MNCCRNSKRRKREASLEYGVDMEGERDSLAQWSDTASVDVEVEMEPLQQGSDTADGNDRQKAAREKLIKILEEMEKGNEPLESKSEIFPNILDEIRKMKDKLLNNPALFEEVWERELKAYEVLVLYGTNAFVENLLETIKDDGLKERISKVKEERDEKKKKEEELMGMIKEDGDFEKINKEITPIALKNCESGSLLMAMKVSFQLRELADQKGADEERFNQLANSLEAFTSRLLDPLRSNEKERAREEFGVLILDHIIDVAIDLDQKKFFTHPAVEDEMTRKFYGRYSKKSSRNWWQLLLFRFFYFWCAVDWCIFPTLFTMHSLLKKRSKQVKQRRRKNSEKGKEEMNIATYEMYWSPYAKYLRDTLSYVIMVLLHYALCLSPSTIAFSRLELAILIFFMGRYLVERQQISNIRQRIKNGGKKDEENTKGRRSEIEIYCLKTLPIYLSDPWNLLDFISILIYLIILTLRVIALLTSGSAMNNRVLAVSGYLYSFNTLCLTLRVFGYMTEQSRHLGVIQIALFNILKDISTIILQFLAGILAFSIAITKVYMTEKSFVANGNARNDITCKNSGISCWWAMVTHLGWSLLGESDKSDPMMSVDFPSDTIAQILYAAFLIFAVVLLLNMLIALLCNTYQRIEDNSLKVWLMKRAVTIQTYDAYDPVPVPLNIVYSIGKLLIWTAWKLMGRKDQEKEGNAALRWCQGLIMKVLEETYFKKCGEVSFPATDEDKIERLLYEQNKTRDDHRENIQHLEQRFEKRVEQMQQLVGQVLHTTFTSQCGGQVVLCGGSEMWKHSMGIQIEGPLLTCKYVEELVQRDARYLKPFSAEVPQFEVVIVETGKHAIMVIGVVPEDYDTSKRLDFYKGALQYRTSDGEIFQDSIRGKETDGPVMACRGDRVRCIAMFENEKVNGGKKQVPFSLFLNGRKMITKEGEDQFFMDSDKPLFPYINMTDGYSVLAKMCPRKVEDRIEALDKKLNTVLAKMVDVEEEYEAWKVHPSITIEGQQLTCGCRECAKHNVCCLHGARCRNNLSPEFPHFEVVILETGEGRRLGIGVVHEHYYMNVMPGWDVGSVGYHIDDGIIYSDAKQKETTGKIYYTCFSRTVMAHRGDRIRCTVRFENEIVIDGKVQVPVMFFLNGKKIITQEGEDQFFIDFNKPLFPYISMTDGGSVLAKMCPRKVCKIEDLDSKVTKSLGKTKWRNDKSERWEHRKGMQIEGRVLTCKDVEEYEMYGARYLKPFSAEFPHLEVVILETGVRRQLGIGVVHEDNDKSGMPGFDEGSVGYHAVDGQIYQSYERKETKGPVMASGGDRIRCTFFFENEKVNHGKKQVPVSFFLNGRKMVTEEGEDQFFIDSDEALYPYVGMTNGCSAWAKMSEKDEPEARLPRWLEKFIAEIWEHREGIQTTGSLLTCKGGEGNEKYGARYRKAFSKEFPIFEVVILETGEKNMLGIGVVYEDYKTDHMPGWYRGTVGYHTDDGNIFHDSAKEGKETEGPVTASQGQRIRCRVMFKNEKEIDGKKKVPIVFILNGKKIVTKEGEDQFLMDSDRPLYPYVGMTNGCSARATILSREYEEDEEHEEFIQAAKRIYKMKSKSKR